jgi:hypothetical protein
MKKIILSLFLCLLALSFATAQEGENSLKPFVNAKGIPYLPEAGDFALGVDASPFLKYLGNLFNQEGTNEAPTFGNEIAIFGKYFIEDNRAIRARLSMEFSNTKYKQTVQDDYELLAHPTNVYATGIDTKSDLKSDILLALGYEFRRGKGRLQGFYGADLLLGYKGFKTEYDYANPLTAANQAPSSYDFEAQTPGRRNVRILENKQAAGFVLGVDAFVGVEYFVTPLISVGGEVNLGFLYDNGQRQNEIKYERFLGDGVQEYKVRRKVADPDNPDIKSGLYTRPNGSFFVIFHF